MFRRCLFMSSAMQTHKSGEYMSKPTKASLALRLKKAGIPVPTTATLKDMQYRLDNWLPGRGYLVRLLRSSARLGHHPVSLLPDKGGLYWMPNSLMARRIIGSRLVLVLDRTDEPSNDAIVVDVPIDYAERWENGGNSDSDS